MLPSELTIEVEQNPAESDEEYVTAQLVQYNIAQAGPSRWKALAIFLRDQKGILQGGLTGYTHWNWLFIARFWLAEDLDRTSGDGWWLGRWNGVPVLGSGRDAFFPVGTRVNR